MNSTQVRTQAQARFTGHYGAASMVNEAIDKERGVVPNSINQPKYGVRNVVNIVLGAALLVVVALVWGVVHEL